LLVVDLVVMMLVVEVEQEDIQLLTVTLVLQL
jgi:hypothetical protein